MYRTLEFVGEGDGPILICEYSELKANPHSVQTPTTLRTGHCFGGFFMTTG